jgi:hypothetical protein
LNVISNESETAPEALVGLHAPEVLAETALQEAVVRLGQLHVGGIDLRHRCEEILELVRGQTAAGVKRIGRAGQRQLAAQRGVPVARGDGAEAIERARQSILGVAARARSHGPVPMNCPDPISRHRRSAGVPCPAAHPQLPVGDAERRQSQLRHVE